jgi:hypothetical protein
MRPGQRFGLSAGHAHPLVLGILRLQHLLEVYSPESKMSDSHILNRGEPCMAWKYSSAINRA